MTTRPNRLLLIIAGIAAAWLVIALLVAPALIREAYQGRSSIDALNRVITGQATHSAAHYVGLWYRAAATISIVGGVLLALWWSGRRFAARPAAALHRVLRREPTVGLSDLARIGLCIGFVGGLAETLSLALRFAFNPDPREAPPIDRLWMAPLATAMLGTLICLVLGVVLRAWRGLSIAVPFLLLTGFAAFSVIRGVKLGIHPYAAMVLAAGIAVELARRAHVHGDAFRHFVRRAVPWVVASTLLGAVGTRGIMWGRERAALAALRTAPEGAPNVLLLILDTVRAEDMSLYGYARQTTPAIERLAATGVTFDRAIVTAPWTLPSHASMFTGLPPHKLSTDFDRPLDDAAPTLAEVLGRRGYATGGFVANPTYASRASGLHRGFATYRDHSPSVEALIDNAFWPRLLTEQVRSAMGREGRLVRKTAEEVNGEVLEWLPTDGRPFFAFLNYFDAHEPYEPHPPFDRSFFETSPRFWLVKGWQRRKSRTELEEIRAAYDGNIAYIDHQIGVLLKELATRGLAENTVVILASDHGEHFGDHGGIMSHANSLYMPLLHVPLVISYPGRVPANRRVQDAVSLQDLSATVLELIGRGDSAAAPGDALPGTSLASYWRAAADSSAGGTGIDSARTLLSLLTYNTFSSSLDPVQQGPMQSVMRGTLHYIRNGDGREELYDVQDDPHELTDLAATDGGDPRLPELRQAMLDMLGTTSLPTTAPRPAREKKRRAPRPKVEQ